MRAKAMPPACFFVWNIVALAQKPSVHSFTQTPDNRKLSHIYLIFLMHFLLYSDNIWLYTGLLLRAAWWMPVFTLLLAFTPETY